MFYGPNYSIAHPGVFPFNLKANRWTMQHWLRSTGGPAGARRSLKTRWTTARSQVSFPAVWAEADDRYDAREIIDDNLKKLDHKRTFACEVMENGSHVDGPFFDAPLCRGQESDFHYVVTNTNEGHNLPTASLGAQPQLWANVVLDRPRGRRLWETGYLDSVRRPGRHPLGRRAPQAAGVRLAVVQPADDVPDHRRQGDGPRVLPAGEHRHRSAAVHPPGPQPMSVINHPPFIRMESQSLAPLGSRRVPYRVPGELRAQPGTYRLSFRMRSRTEPPVLHAVLRIDGRDAAGDERVDARLPPDERGVCCAINA